MIAKKSYRPTLMSYINYETGYVKPSRPSIEEQIAADYNLFSYNYWLGAKKRQREYLERQKLAKIIA